MLKTVKVKIRNHKLEFKLNDLIELIYARINEGELVKL